MAYLGRQPVIGNFVKLDAITAVNGQAAYTMQNGSVNFSDYSTVNQFLISLNGTIQSPGSSFTVSGSTLTFASNLSTGDVIDFIMVFGNSLSAGTPTDATVTTAKLADDAVTSEKVSDGVLKPPHRNIIINGDMSIAQRSTSEASITSDGYKTIDRFQTLLNTAGTWTQSQDTTVPSGQGFAKSLKMDCTTADASLAAGDYLIVQQKFEGQNLQYLKKGTSSAESLTASFWVRSNKTGTYIAELRDRNNDRTASQSYTISAADTWEKKTVTFAGDTSGAFNNDNAASLDINFWLAAGTTYTSGTLQTSFGSRVQANRAVGQVNLADSTSNEWYITGIQLEVGSAASDFEFLPVDVNLNRCLRYCLNIGSIDSSNYEKFGIGTNASTTQVFGITPFPVPMRTQPSLTVTSTASDYGVYHTGDLACSSVPTLNANTTDKVGAVTFTVASGLTSGGASVLQENGNSGAYLIWSAEL